MAAGSVARDRIRFPSRRFGSAAAHCNLEQATGARMIAQSSSEKKDTKRSFNGSRGDPLFTALAAKIFWGSIPARTVAIVACYPGEGATFVAKSLQTFLSDEGTMPVSLVSAESFLASRDSSHADDLNASVGERGGIAGDEIFLVDCPALFLSPSAIRACPHVDGIVLVIEDGARSKAEIQRAVSMVEAVEGRVLGAVLNKRRYLLPDWLYSLLS